MEPNDLLNTISVRQDRATLGSSSPRHRVRAALYALLALCVCAAQLGTFLHALSHLQGTVSAATGGASSFVAPDHDAGADELCLQCLAFAQLASATPGTPFVTPVAEPAPAALPAYRQRVRHAGAEFVFLARGPPPAL
jgi:hypothetical protein